MPVRNYYTQQIRLIDRAFAVPGTAIGFAIMYFPATQLSRALILQEGGGACLVVGGLMLLLSRKMVFYQVAMGYGLVALIFVIGAVRDISDYLTLIGLAVSIGGAVFFGWRAREAKRNSA